MALAADLLDCFQRHRAEGRLASPATRLEQEDPAASTGRPNPDPETGQAAVPDRIFALAGAQAGDGRVGEPHVFLAHQRSALQHGADCLGGLVDHCVGKMRVFERRLRTAVSEQFSDREDGLALSQREAGMRVPQIVKAHAAQVRFRTDPAPEELCPILGDGVIRRRREFWFRRPAYRL